MVEVDTSVCTKIGRDWIKSICLVLICLAVSSIMIWALTIEPDGYHDRRLQNGAYVMAPFMVPFTIWVTYRLVLPFGALLVMAPEGFADRRVNAQIIPWSEITNIVRRGEFTSLTLSRRFVKSYHFSPSQRLIKWYRKSARPSHLLVAQWCVAPGEIPFATIVNAYHSAHSGRPKEL